MPVVRGSESALVGVEIAVYNLAEVQRALKAIAPTVEKEMNRAIRTALNETRDVARARIPDSPPMSGWRQGAAAKGRSRGGAGWPGWNPGAMRAGITVGRGNGRGRRISSINVAWRLQSSEAAATIFDKAAEGHSSVGEQFVSNLHDREGTAQRVLWPAWLATRKVALEEVAAAIGRAEQVVQSYIDNEQTAKGA